MRVASFIAVGILVTTAYFAVRHLTERDDSTRPRGAGLDDGGGTTVPTTTPTRALEPGERLTISLNREPATHYASGNGTSDGDAYAALASEAANNRGIYDLALGRAAAEIAVQGALHRVVAPEVVTTFILHSSGAPDSSAARYSLRTNATDESVITRAIDEALATPPDGPGELYFGVGEAATPADGHARHIVVLMARRDFKLDPTPRVAQLGETWQASGELPSGFADATAKALFPSGELADVKLDVRGRRFTMRLETGNEVGSLSVGIDGVGSRGPGKLMQITIEVGRPAPRELSLIIPPADPDLPSIEDAEDHAALLLAIDRENAGSRPLEVDPELTAIARAHSEEMATSKFFGHRSPTTGLAGDRIESAGYRAAAFAENLAKNDSLAEAESSLLGSVGHRANLLSDTFTHVGVGVARANERGQTQLYVTQLFARKAVDLDEGTFTDEIYQKVTEARERAGLGGLEVSEQLERIAAEGARQAIDGETDNLAKRLGREARDALRRSVSVSVQVIYTKDQLELPEAIKSDALAVLGIGVVQSRTDRAGKIGVVLITGRQR